MNDYRTGFAFIFEGDTEKVFYEVFLKQLCQKYNAKIERREILDSADVIYELETDAGISLIKYNVATAISQIPKKGAWFQSQCIDKYKNSSDERLEWYIFLCYDKDNYKEDISEFVEGVWCEFRNELSAWVSGDHIIDVAAAADIEDIMLLDLPNICNFIGCDVPESLSGRKGKVKLKKLFRDNNKYYHEGKRAKELIEQLDMDAIEKMIVFLFAKLKK